MQNYLLLLATGIAWGSQFMFTHIAVQTLSPSLIAATRALVAGLCLSIVTLCIRCFKRTNNACAKTHIKFTFVNKIKLGIIALLETVIPFYLIAWGQQYVSSSVSAIILGMIPLVTAVFTTLFVDDEKMSLGLYLSVICGFLGLIILLWPSLSQADFTHLLAEAAIFIGACCFATALVLIRTLPKTDPIPMTRTIFLLGSIPLVLNTVITDPNSLMQFTVTNGIAVFMLGALCSACAYTLFVILIQRAGATFAALSNYLVPLVGAILGVIILGDVLDFHLLIALGIILIALLLARLPHLNKP